MKIIVIFNPKGVPDTFRNNDFKGKVLNILKTGENRNIDFDFIYITYTTTSNRIRDEENNYNLIEVDADEAIIKIMSFKNGKFILKTTKSFKRENF